MKGLAILLAVIGLPIAEIWLVATLVGDFGWGPVLVAGAVFLGLGIAMMRLATQKWGRAAALAQVDQGFLNTGFGPAMGDAAIIFVGGLLMVVPGFITGVVGLLLVLPPVRHLVRRVFRGRIETAAAQRGSRSVTVIEGETLGGAEPPRADAGPPRTDRRDFDQELPPTPEGPWKWQSPEQDPPQ